MTLTLLRHLDRSVFEPRLLLLRPEGELIDRVPSDVPVEALGASRLWAAVGPLARRLRRAPPDLLFSTSGGTNPLAILGRSLAGAPCPVVLSERNVLWRDGGRAKRRLLNLLKRATYGRATRITAVSEGVRWDLVHHLRLPPERVEVVLNPVVTAEMLELSRRPADHPWTEDSGRPLLLAAGRLVPAKGFDLLLEALVSVRRRHDARLLLLGEGPQRAALEERARRLGIDAVVALPGRRENPWAFMRRATVFVLPSRHEGLPGVLIEAMACGAAVVAADCHAGPREILRDGEDGLLAPPENAAAIAARIDRLLSDPELRAALGRRAAESARRYAAERVVVAYERVLKSACGRTTR